jgi:hypothetical protein
LEHEKLKSLNVNIDAQSALLPQLKDLLAGSLGPLTHHRLFAFPPYPSCLHSIYLHRLSKQSYLPALITILSLFLSSDLYTYAQTFHPVLVTRLYTIAKLLKHVASMSDDELREEIGWFGSGAPEVAKTCQNIDFVGAWYVVLVIVLEEGRKAHGEGTSFVEEVREELRDGENAVGDGLKRWKSNALDREGSKEAETVCKGLLRLAGMLELALRG